MWARAAEVMLGLWLMAGPFVFGHPPGEPRLWWNDLGCGSLVIVVSLLSFWSRTSHAHLLNVGLGLWLVGFGYLGFERPPPAAAQNAFATGILLLMLAIIPSEASRPPRGWRELEEAKRRGAGRRAERR